MVVRKNVTRIGDKVRIVAPVRFIRCGYKLSLNDLTEIIYKEQNDQIFKFLISMVPPKQGLRKTKTTRKSTAMVARAIAYEMINDQIRSGNKRRLFLEPFNTAGWQVPPKGALGVVVAIRYVKTGTYVHGYCSYNSFDGCYDDEPSYLKDEKTFKLLKLEFDQGYNDEWVLDKHVKKV